MLTNTLYRLKVQKRLNIGFFGGSITDGTGASDMEKTSYRGLVTDWFKNTFPEAEINSFNCAIGGTGTALGMYRCRADLLSKEPGLVFVEFAVNDHGDEYGKICAQTESIIRQIKNSDPTREIVFLISTSAEIVEAREKSEFITSVAAHRRVAEYYSIPVFDHGEALRLHSVDQDVPLEVLIPDTLHPSDLGHSVMAEFNIDELKKLLKGEADALISYAMPEKLCTECADTANMLPCADLEDLSLDGFTLVDGGERFGKVLTASEGGASFSFTFTGTGIGVCPAEGFRPGDVKVSVDGGEEIVIRHWGNFVRSFHRMASALVKDSFPYGKHRVKITAVHGSLGIEAIFVR